MELKDLIGEATTYDKKERLEAGRPKSWLDLMERRGSGMKKILGEYVRFESLKENLHSSQKSSQKPRDAYTS